MAILEMHINAGVGARTTERTRRLKNRIKWHSGAFDCPHSERKWENAASRMALCAAINTNRFIE